VIRVQHLANRVERSGTEIGYRDRPPGRGQLDVFYRPAGSDFRLSRSERRSRNRDDQEADHSAGSRPAESWNWRDSTRACRTAKPGRHSPSSCRIPASTANKRDSKHGPACRALPGCALVLEVPVLEDPALGSARNLSGALRTPIFARSSGIPPGNRAADYPLSPLHLPLPR
jgi:hypothetical protein